jgi:hypothetical protein
MSQQSTQSTTEGRAREGASGGGDPELQNEGEGSRSAGRRYDADAERAASDEARVKELAKQAREAIEGAASQSLREAEEQGKKAQHH